MPLIKRKPVELLPPPDPPKEGEPEPDVYYLAATGEIFNDYELVFNQNYPVLSTFFSFSPNPPPSFPSLFLLC